MDLGKYLTHWVVVAWKQGATGQVVDYGRIEVPSDHMGLEPALLVALRQFRDLCLGGWPQAQGPGAVPPGNPPLVKPTKIFIDSGYMAPVVYSFCRETQRLFSPAIGRGASQQRPQQYNRPTSRGNIESVRPTTS